MFRSWVCILGKAPQKRLIGIPCVVSWGSSVGAGGSTYGRVCSRPAGRCWLSAGTSARAEAGRPASLLTGCLVFLQHSGWTPSSPGKETFLLLSHRECRAWQWNSAFSPIQSVSNPETESFYFFIFKLLFIFLAMSSGVQDLSSTTRDWTRVPCSGNADS